MDKHPLHTKLQLKPGMRMLALEAPPEFLHALAPLPESSTLSLHTEPGQTFDWVHLHVANQAELAAAWPIAKSSVKAGGQPWIAYPKLTDKIKTDLTRDRGWAIVDADDYHGVRLISLDDTWSSFRLRPRHEIKIMTRKFERK